MHKLMWLSACAEGALNCEFGVVLKSTFKSVNAFSALPHGGFFFLAIVLVFRLSFRFGGDSLE